MRLVRDAVGIAVAIAIVMVGMIVCRAVAQASTTTTAVSSTTTTSTIPCQTQYALQKAVNKAVAPTATTPGTAAQLSGCYDVTGTEHLKVTDGVTIDGNGATINQPKLGPAVAQTPIIALEGVTGVTFSDLKLNGPYAGKDGGSAYEGAAGILMEDDHDIAFSDVDISNVQGDFVDLYPASDHALNTGISWTGSTFTNAGYHGIVPEAVDGVTFSQDKLSRIGIDAIDAENDTYSSTFSNGQPTFAAVDLFTFSDDVVSKWGADLYASLQPQLPGVQEQGVRIIDNRVSGGAPFVQIIGADTTTARYQTSGIAIAGNVAYGPLRDTASSSGQPFSGSVMTLKNVSNVTVIANRLPIFFGSKPSLGFVTAHGVDGLTVAANVLPGALGVVNPTLSSGNTSTAVCSNTYGATAQTTDAVCP